jgi:hypothetical protein
MRLAVQHRDLATGLHEGTAVDGYVVEGLVDRHVGAELRYLMRGPDGEEATLITTRRPPGRRDRLRIRRLASLRRRLAHPAVLPAHASGEHEGHPYLITDPYPAATLGDLLADEAFLAPEWLLAQLAPVAAALDGREQPAWCTKRSVRTAS